MTGPARWLVGGAIVAAVIAGGLAVALSDGDDKDRRAEGAETTTTRPPEPTTTTTTEPGFATPEDAIADHVASQGNEYAGDCSGTDVETDVGKWCSGLTEDNGTTRVYFIGPTFSEGAEQLTLTQGPGGWQVTATEPVPPIGE